MAARGGGRIRRRGGTPAPSTRAADASRALPAALLALGALILQGIIGPAARAPERLLAAAGIVCAHGATDPGAGPPDPAAPADHDGDACCLAACRASVAAPAPAAPSIPARRRPVSLAWAPAPPPAARIAPPPDPVARGPPVG